MALKEFFGRSTKGDVRVVMTSHGRGKVFIDGHKIPGVRAIQVSCRIKEQNILTLEMVTGSLQVEGPFEVDQVGD